MATYNELNLEKQPNVKQIFLLRHCISNANLGIKEFNANLAESGIEQAKNLVGNVDLVIISELNRTRQTLEYSNIKYNVLFVSYLCNEIKQGEIENCVNFSDTLIIETMHDVEKRIIEFKKLLLELNEKYQKILVISHAGFLRLFLNSNSYLHNAEYTMWNRQ